MHVVYSMFSWMLYSLTFGQDTPVSQQCANPPNLLFFLDWRYSLEGMEDYVGVFNIRHILPALFRAFYEIIYINCDLLFYPLHYTSVSCYEITYAYWRPFYRRFIGRFMWPEQCTLYGECATSSQPNPATDYELQCNCYSYNKIPLKAALDEVASSLVIKPHQNVQG